MEIHMRCHVHAAKEASRLLHEFRRREANMPQRHACMYAPRRAGKGASKLTSMYTFNQRS